MELIGSFGIGAVTGWMVGRLEGGQQMLRTVLATSAAIALILLEISWFAGTKGLLAACAAGTLTFFIHRLWLQALKEQQSHDIS